MSGSAPSTLYTWATNASTRVAPTSGEQAAGYALNQKPPARKFNGLIGNIFDWLAYYGSKNAAGGVVGLDDTTGGATVTATASNAAAFTGTGHGTGYGLRGIGGTSGGTGVRGEGDNDATGGRGGSFIGGTGTTFGGAGIAATGGAGVTNGSGGNGGTFVGGAKAGSGGGGHGVHATAADDACGVYGLTSGTGHGVYGESSGSGVAAVRGVASSATLAAGHFVNSSASGSSYGAYVENTGGGRGLIVIADTTSPTHAALRIVPQNAEPTGADSIQNEVGDMYVTTAGVLKICTVAGVPGTWVSVGAQT